ncbi:MAG: 2-oxoacid:acceptor oxidoreductase family protein [Candidatus Woesearchaeota archaeon]
MSAVKEITILGRGGQGAVTAAELIAKAVFHEGKQSQAFPSFGVERRGAPVSAFCRISEDKITLRSQIYAPEYVLVLDSTLLSSVDIQSLSKKKGTLIVNTSKEINGEIKREGIKIFSADLSSIAKETFGADIVNTAIVAAFAAFTKEISIGSVEEALPEIFEDKNLLNKNIAAVRKAYNICIKMMEK